MGPRGLMLCLLTIYLEGKGLEATSTSPRPPAFLFTRHIDPYTVRLIWLVPRDTPVNQTMYKIGLKRSSLKSPETVRVVQGTSGNQVFRNLTPYTYYYFRVKRGFNGTYGPFSRTIWVETSETVPTASPTNVTAYNTSSMGIMVYWGQVPPEHRNGHILGYKICYRKKLDPPKLQFCTPVHALGLHLGGLEPYTPYYITVQASTNIGDGPACKPILVWTDQFVPSEAPQIQSIQSTTTTISLNWNHIPTQFVHGILRGYYIVLFELPMKIGRKNVLRVNATATSVQIKELRSNITYGVKIAGSTRVRGSMRIGKVSHMWNITTKLRCGPPANVNAHSTCPKCMTVQWDPVTPGEPGQTVQGYEMTLKSTRHAPVLYKIIGARTIARVNGLMPHTRYTITLAARTVDGIGEYSQPIKQITQEDVPEIAPEKVTVRSTGPNSLLIKWSPVPDEQANGALKGYHVYYSSVTNRARRSTSYAGVLHALAVNASALSVEITGLKAFSTYSVEVAGFTAKGSGPKSSPISVKTDEDVPSQAPGSVKAKVKSATSIIVTWQSLSMRFINGRLLGYHVIYKTKTADFTVLKNAITVNASVLHVTVRGLEHTTEYEMWVQAFTVKGAGPGSNKITATTLKIVPGQPQDVDIDVISPRSVKVTWQAPIKSVGEVTRYMVKWTLRGHPDIKDEDGQKIVKVTKPYHRRTTVVGLKPYNMFTFVVCEESNDSWGSYSEPVDQMLPEDAPSAPLGLSVKRKDDVTLILQWQKPEWTNGVIRKYVLYFANEKGILLWEETVDSGVTRDTISHTLTLPDRTSEYKIRVQAFNSKAGQMSDVLTVQHLSSDSLGYASNSNKYFAQLPWLILGLGAIVLLLLGVLIFILIRRANRRAKDNNPEESIPMTPKNFGARRPVPVIELKQHCDSYHANDDALFVEEFRTLNHLTLRATFEASHTPYNKTKNRYPNILPYDHSRVVLRVRKDSPGSDYINANFIDGYGCPQKYIAAQGPLTETVNEFWRMIWEKGCVTIVMLGDTENNMRLRNDCERYWPEHGHQEYGDIAASTVDTIQMTDWTVRTFLVWSTDPECMDKREITQFQYTAWPDQGVPENTASMIIFHHKFKISLPPERGPILVHCGAGVGRTGTFIAIDSLMDQMLMEGVGDVYGFVAQMRTQRNYMVQTEEQYAFIHDVLRDVSLCGITEIPSQEVATRLLVLCENDPDISLRRHDEFNNLPLCDSEEFERSVAYIRENIVKNRCPDVVPFDENRVRLTIISDVPCSEYINASYIDGYNEGHAYIATQAPMENTVIEFWQMVWEQKCTAIVMLTELTDRGQDESEQYWPIEGCLRYGKYIVTKIDEEQLVDHTQRVLKLRCHGSMDSLLVYHFQYHNWQNQGLPPRVNGLVCLHEQVQKIQLVEDYGPTIVHCSDGASRTGVYLTLVISIDRLEAEDSVDVFQTVRWLRSQRPGMVGNVDQYSFCYQAVKSYLSWRTRTTNDYITG